MIKVFLLIHVCVYNLYTVYTYIYVAYVVQSYIAVGIALYK